MVKPFFNKNAYFFGGNTSNKIPKEASCLIVLYFPRVNTIEGRRCNNFVLVFFEVLKKEKQVCKENYHKKLRNDELA